MLLLSAAARLLPPAAPPSAVATCQSHYAAALSCAASLLPPAAPLLALATCQSHQAAALSCSAFAAASSTTQRIGDLPIAPCCCSQLLRVCCRQPHHSAHWRLANRTMLLLHLQRVCCRQPHHSAHWRLANRIMLLLLAAARLLPPASPLSALAACHSHYAAALSCSVFAAASRTTQRVGDMPIALCCRSQLQRVCCRQQHHSAQWRLANRIMLLLSAAARWMVISAASSGTQPFTGGMR